MTSDRPKQGKRILSDIAAVLFCIGTAYYLLFLPGLVNQVTWGLDDACMYLRYAGNILAGHGIAWNPEGPPTYGFTSSLYLLVITLGRLILPEALPAGALLTGASWLFGLLALLMISFAGRQMFHEPWLKRSFVIPALVVLVCITSGSFRGSALNGMESSLAILSNALLIIFALRSVKLASPGSFVLVALCSYITFLVRPDNLIFGALLPPLLYLSREIKERRSALIWFCSSLAILLVLDTALKYFLFGDPLPLPFYVKLGGFYQGYTGYTNWNPVKLYYPFLYLALPFCVVTAIFIRRQNISLILPYFIPILISTAYFLTVVQIMGFSGRFYIPALPLFAFAAFEAASSAMTRDSLRSCLGPVRIGIIVIIVAVIVIAKDSLIGLADRRLAFKQSSFQVPESKLPKLGWHNSLRGIMRLLSKLPAGSTVAATEHGYLGAVFKELKITDMTGLHNPELARAGFSAAAILANKPAVIWLPDSHYTGMVHSLTRAPEFADYYYFIPGAMDYGVAILKSSANFELLITEFEKIMMEFYGVSSPA